MAFESDEAFDPYHEVETSIVEWAEKTYVPKASPARVESPPIVPAMDGYIRTTPVQGMRIPDDYRKRMIIRAVMIFFGVVFVAAVAFVLVKFVIGL